MFIFAICLPSRRPTIRFPGVSRIRLLYKWRVRNFDPGSSYGKRKEVYGDFCLMLWVQIKAGIQWEGSLKRDSGAGTTYTCLRVIYLLSPSTDEAAGGDRDLDCLKFLNGLCFVFLRYEKDIAFRNLRLEEEGCLPNLYSYRRYISLGSQVISGVEATWMKTKLFSEVLLNQESEVVTPSLVIAVSDCNLCVEIDGVNKEHEQ